MLMLDHLSELLDCFIHVIPMPAAVKLLKITYMTHSFNFMNNTAFPLTHTKNRGVSLCGAQTCLTLNPH